MDDGPGYPRRAPLPWQLGRLAGVCPGAPLPSWGDLLIGDNRLTITPASPAKKRGLSILI